MFLYTGQQTNHSHSTLSFNDVSPQSWDALKLENDIAWLMDYIGIPAWEHNRRRLPLIASLFVCAFCQKFLWESLLRGDPAEGSVAKMRFFLFLRADVVVAVVLYSLFSLFDIFYNIQLWVVYGYIVNVLRRGKHHRSMLFGNRNRRADPLETNTHSGIINLTSSFRLFNLSKS